jgi:hypothetical protein
LAVAALAVDNIMRLSQDLAEQAVVEVAVAWPIQII